MRILPFCVILLAALFLPGCSHEEKADAVSTSRPIDNNSPAAASGKAAPVDPSIQYPGMMKKRGMQSQGGN